MSGVPCGPLPKHPNQPSHLPSAASLVLFKMHKITLVCSTHRENGLCNARELLRILEAIGPNISFEEIRPQDFESYCKHGPKSSVEAQALEGYLRIRSFRRVPVDQYEMPTTSIADLKLELDSLLDYVHQASREYQLLDEQNQESAHARGFFYLNSAACETSMMKLAELEDKVIGDTGDYRLAGILQRWREFNRRREREMIDRIYQHSRSSASDTAVFLVGAAHKAGIVKEIERYSTVDAGLIDWRLSL